MTQGLIKSANLPTVRGEAIKLPDCFAEPGAGERWKSRVSDPDALVAIDLFCGAGGMTLGFENAGFVVAAGIDSDSVACQTHAANFLSKTKNIDIGTVTDPLSFVSRDLEIPRVDVVIGGPPCQGFSLAGRSKLRSLQAQDPEVQKEIDAKNALYKEFVAFVGALKPLLFVMENVPHLSSYGQGVIAEQISRDFEAVGYQVWEEVLDASHFGVPQVRRRLFYIGSRVGRIWRPPLAAFRQKPRSLEDAIGDLPVVPAPSLQEQLTYAPRRVSGYQELMRSSVRPEDEGFIYDHVVRPIRDDDRVIFQMMKPGDKYKDVPEEYRRYTALSFEDKYYKLPWHLPCVTITAHMARDGYRYIHPEQLRTLSVREAARIQSFPDSFRFVGHRSSRYRQIGNAVPPLLAEVIGRSLARALRRHRAIFSNGNFIDLDDVEPWQLGLPSFEYMTEAQLPVIR